MRSIVKWPVLKAQAILFLLLSIGSTAQTRHDLRLGRELSIGGIGLASFSLGRFVVKEKPLDTLMLFDRSEIPGIDRIALDRWSIPAHRTSDIVMSTTIAASLAIPLIVQQGEEPMIPITIIVESLLLTSGITSIAKHSIARPRPYVYGMDVPLRERPENGNLVSFWSGHTSTASSVTFACASLVHRSNATGELKTATWIGAAALPLAVGFYRIKAGRHFPTDVLTGFAFGALIGWGVPYLHRAE